MQIDDIYHSIHFRLTNGASCQDFCGHNVKGRVAKRSPIPIKKKEKETHCLFSNREGLGTSLLIMELATIAPHSHKVQTKLYKILKFGVNQTSFD